MPVQEAARLLSVLRVLLVHVCSQIVEPCSHTCTLITRCVMRLPSIMWVYRVVFAADESPEHALKDEMNQTVTPSKVFPGPLQICRHLYQ